MFKNCIGCFPRAVYGAGHMRGLTHVSQKSGQRNIVLIAIDTLRADYLPCYGNTSELDNLAADPWEIHNRAEENTGMRARFRDHLLQ